MSSFDDGALRALWERMRAGGMKDPLLAAEQLALLMVVRAAGTTSKRWAELIDDPVSAFESLQERYPPWASQQNRPFSIATRDARLALPSPQLLASAMAFVDATPIDDAPLVLDAILREFASTGHQGALYTPPALIDLITSLVRVKPHDRVCDPACGSGSLLTAAVMTPPSDLPRSGTTYGYDIEPMMVRLTAANLGLSGIRNVVAEARDSLKTGHSWPQCEVVVTDPPFANVAADDIDPELAIAGARSELLFVERARRMLVAGGTCAIVVPQSVLFGTSKTHVAMRRRLLETTQIELIVSLTGDTFDPALRLTAALMVFHTGSRTNEVLFHEPSGPLSNVASEIDEARITLRGPGELHETESGASWMASRADIMNASFDLSPRRYRPFDEEALAPDPRAVLAEIRDVEQQFSTQLDVLARLLARD